MVIAGAVAWPLVTHAHGAFDRLQAVDVSFVVVAGLLHVAMLVASALCWRRAFRACGGRVGKADACVRYGVGTFLNIVIPARAGGAVRIGLFARSLSGDESVRRAGVALAGIGFARGAAVSLIVAAAAGAGAAPRWLICAPFVLAVAAVLARHRIGSVRAHLRERDAAVLFCWAGLATACRCASIVAALAAVGVPGPIAAGVIGLVGLELSALVPIAPGLAGVGGAAVAVAIAAHGVPAATAFAAGVAFYVAEGAAGIAFGIVATAAFIVVGDLRWRRRPTESGVPVPAW